MKRLKRIILIALSFVMLVGLIPIQPIKTYAADKYTDAKTFFESITDEKKMEFADDGIYFATKAHWSGATSASYELSSKTTTDAQAGVSYGLNSRATYMTFTTLGFHIAVTDRYTSGKSMFVEIADDGQYIETISSCYTYGDGYWYTLYYISYDTIFKLMRLKDAATAQTIEKGTKITFRVDNICTSKMPGYETYTYAVQENGNGTLTEIRMTQDDEGYIWYLNDEEDYSSMDDCFNSSIEYMHDIRATLDNYALTITYHSEYTTAISTKGYSVNDKGEICYNNQPYKTQITRFNCTGVTLPDVSSKMGFSCDGCKLKSKCWKNKDGSISLSSGTNYSVYELSNTIAKGDSTLELYINWDSSSYYIQYEANGGVGATAKTKTPYNATVKIAQNGFYKANYEFTGWNTRADGTGTSYKEGQSVSKLSSVDGSTVILYAQWEPLTYSLYVKEEDNTIVDTFYQKYATGYFLSQADALANKNKVDAINLPSEKRGYSFAGLYLSPYTTLHNIVNSSGSIVTNNTYFTEDSHLYIHWKANEYEVIFNQQGGENGTEGALVTYDELMPQGLIAPYKKGYSFCGYYTEPDGQGTQYYNEFMSPLKKCDFTETLTLYAYWVDKELPTAKLYMTTDWSNNPAGIKIQAVAKDDGSGLSKMYLYMENSDGEELVASNTTLNGSKEGTITHYHTKEGAYTYRLEVWDLVMDDTKEGVMTYKVAKYDITDPYGEIVNEETDLDDLTDATITIYVTDYNVE